MWYVEFGSDTGYSYTVFDRMLFNEFPSKETIVEQLKNYNTIEIFAKFFNKFLNDEYDIEGKNAKWYSFDSNYFSIEKLEVIDNEVYI